MRRLFGLIILLSAGCLVAPELITEEPPAATDAGSATDAGPARWSILPASGSLFGDHRRRQTDVTSTTHTVRLGAMTLGAELTPHETP